jgi:hypothetical protein
MGCFINGSPTRNEGNDLKNRQLFGLGLLRFFTKGADQVELLLKLKTWYLGSEQRMKLTEKFILIHLLFLILLLGLNFDLCSLILHHRVASLLDFLQVSGDKFATLVEVLGMSSRFFQGQQHVVAFYFAEQLFADGGDGFGFTANGSNFVEAALVELDDLGDTAVYIFHRCVMSPQRQTNAVQRGNFPQ